MIFYFNMYCLNVLKDILLYSKIIVLFISKHPPFFNKIYSSKTANTYLYQGEIQLSN